VQDASSTELSLTTFVASYSVLDTSEDTESRFSIQAINTNLPLEKLEPETIETIQETVTSEKTIEKNEVEEEKLENKEETAEKNEDLVADIDQSVEKTEEKTENVENSVEEVLEKENVVQETKKESEVKEITLHIKVGRLFSSIIFVLFLFLRLICSVDIF
jgi:uncharacterized protein (DUF342 family)